MRMKRIALVGGAAALAVGLASCSASPAEPVEPTYDSPVDLKMTVWTADEKIIATYQALADEFREENPELGELEIQTIPFAEYTAQMTIQLSGGDAPDIGWVVESTMPAFANSGLLHDISALTDVEEYNWDEVIPGLYEALQGENGEIYGYPFANTTHPITYNKTAFEAAGVDTPLDLYERGEWDWENLRRISKELVDAGVVTYGFDIPQFNYTNYALFTPFLKAFGAEAYPEGTTCGYADPESIEAFEFLHGMIFADKSYPAPGSASNFPTGDTGMYLGPPSSLNALTDIDFEFEMVPQPNGVDGELDPFLGQAALVAFKDGQAPELATRLLGFFTSEYGSSVLQRYYVPPRESLLTPAGVAQLNPLLSPDAAERSLIEPLAVAKQIDYPVAYPELESTVRPILDAAWQPDGDIDATVKAACKAADPILADE